MTTEFLNPSGIAAPVGAYTHSVRVSGPGQWLHIAGQIGIDSNGVLANGTEAQAETAWNNLVAVLGNAGMSVQHLVKLTTYLVNAQDAPAVGAVRLRHLGDVRPAATLVIAKELGRPEWTFEIEAIAFRAD